MFAAHALREMARATLTIFTNILANRGAGFFPTLVCVPWKDLACSKTSISIRSKMQEGQMMRLG